MKKIKLVILSSLLFSFVASCNNNSSSSSITSYEITGIEILGPRKVEVNKSINLTADVLSTPYDDVIWSSENDTIAKVNENGKVTGIDEGEVNIIATSALNPEIKAQYLISVFKPKATKLKLDVTSSSDITYDENKDTYIVPLGKKFVITALPNSSSEAMFDYFSFEAILPSNADSSIVSMNRIADNSVEVIAYDDLDQIAIKVTGNYLDSATGGVSLSAFFDVEDENIKNKEAVINQLNLYKTEEASKLISSSYSLTKTSKELTSSDVDKTITSHAHHSYQTASYINREVKTYINDVETSSKVENLYNGIVNDNYYFFSYDENNNIDTVYQNVEDPLHKNHDKASSFATIVNESPFYSYASLLETYFTSSSRIDSQFVSFANIFAYANASFIIENDHLTVNADYIDTDTNYHHQMSLEIAGNNNRLSSFRFYEAVTNNTHEYTYEAVGSDFVYGERDLDVSTNDPYLDINSYYMTSFDLVELAGITDVNGKYDYSNTKKYGADSISIEDGLTKYTLTYDKTLVFALSNIQPANASTKIDVITAVSSSPDNIPNISIVGDSPITISPKKDDNNHAQAGKSTFTFTSQNGFEKKIIVEFIDFQVKDVYINSNHIVENTFKPIFQNRLSDYFYVQTNPDEDKYTFGLDIIQGNPNGLEIFDYSDDNRYGIPGFAFAIKGLIVGSYEFKLYVKEKDTVKTAEVYKIEVLEPLSDEYLKSQLVSDSYYEIASETMSLELRFVSETSATITQKFVYGDTISQSFNYKIEDSYLKIESTQTFSSFYFSKIYEGTIDYANDLSSVSLMLEIYEETAAEKEIDNYFYATFAKHIDKSQFDEYINHKTFNLEQFIPGYRMAHFTLSFENNNGTLIIKNGGTGEVTCTITFTYTYDKSLKKLVIDNINSSSSSWNIDTSSRTGAFNETKSTLQLSLTYNGSDNLIEFNV